MRSDLLKQTEIFVFLALVFSVFVASLLSDKQALEGEIEQLEIESNLFQIDSIDKFELIEILNEVKQLRKHNDSLKKCISPPHVIIDSQDSFFFESGSAIISNEFSLEIRRKVIPQIVRGLNKCKSCNTVYIIGHTDEKTVEPSEKTEIKQFDKKIVNAIFNNCNFHEMPMGTNSDLGLLRACSVYCELKKSKELEQLKYWHPYSAGLLINTNNQIIRNINGGDIPKRRRIEIRLFAL